VGPPPQRSPRRRTRRHSTRIVRRIPTHPWSSLCARSCSQILAIRCLIECRYGDGLVALAAIKHATDPSEPCCMSKALPSLIPLPRDWHKHVKSALLHAIGLERLALIAARAGFENGPDPRAAMAAENDRLRELVAIREEEIRIKDARLRAIPARERPVRRHSRSRESHARSQHRQAHEGESSGQPSATRASSIRAW
jgi:hypothetical protein